MSNPRALTRLAIPSIANLRELAKGTHFVGQEGQIRILPKRFRSNPKYYASSVNDGGNLEAEAEGANERLTELLKQLAENEETAEVGTVKRRRWDRENTEVMNV